MTWEDSCAGQRVDQPVWWDRPASFCNTLDRRGILRYRRRQRRTQQGLQQAFMAGQDVRNAERRQARSPETFLCSLPTVSGATRSCSACPIRTKAERHATTPCPPMRSSIAPEEHRSRLRSSPAFRPSSTRKPDAKETRLPIITHWRIRRTAQVGIPRTRILRVQFEQRKQGVGCLHVPRCDIWKHHSSLLWYAELFRA